MRFDTPVADYMNQHVEWLAPDAPLPEVARRLADRKISAVPLVAADGKLAGVVSRSDLLRTGRLAASSGPRTPALELPPIAARTLVTGPALVCAPSTTLRAAAREMVRHRVHRLFVTIEDRLVGVISTVDLARAVRDHRLELSIEQVMTAPVVTIAVTATLGEAVGQLDRARLTGLIVVDERWPIGMFTQTEAMAARDLPRETSIEDLYDPAVICLPAKRNIRVAAAHAARLDVRRVVACEVGEAVGIVGGLDFARVVAV
jgi:CBS domain-containing protein